MMRMYSGRARRVCHCAPAKLDRTKSIAKTPSNGGCAKRGESSNSMPSMCCFAKPSRWFSSRFPPKVKWYRGCAGFGMPSSSMCRSKCQACRNEGFPAAPGALSSMSTWCRRSGSVCSVGGQRPSTATSRRHSNFCMRAGLHLTSAPTCMVRPEKLYPHRSLVLPWQSARAECNGPMSEQSR